MVEKLRRIKTFKGWKTIGFNVLAGLGPVALDFGGYILNYPGLQNLLPEGHMTEYVLAMGIANLVLRYFTDTAVGSKY